MPTITVGKLRHSLNVALSDYIPMSKRNMKKEEEKEELNNFERS